MNPASAHQNELYATSILSVNTHRTSVASRGEIAAASTTMHPHMSARLAQERWDVQDGEPTRGVAPARAPAAGAGTARRARMAPSIEEDPHEHRSARTRIRHDQRRAGEREAG